MTSDNSSRTQAPRRSGLGKRMAIPGWAIILLAFILSGAIISFLWYRAQESFVKPYYECRSLKSVSLYPIVQDVQVQVEYPRRISQDDRGVQHHKRLVVSVTKMEAGPSELIGLAVKPVSGHIHFLTEKGGDRSGQLIITATHGIMEVHTLYIEHPNVPPGGPISLSLQILPPTGAITQPVSVEKSDFAIEEEPFIAGTIRGVVSLMPWETFLLSFLAVPGALLKTLWDRRKGMADLHGKMKQAWEERKIDDIRSIYSEYHGLVLCRIPFFWSTALSIPGHRGVELLHRKAEASFHFEQARNALQRKATREAEGHLTTALEWDPDYGKVRPLYELVCDLEKGHKAWWIKPMPGSRYLRWLSGALEDSEKTQAEVRRQIANVLGHIEARETRRAIEKALREDNDLSIQAQAAWMLARRPRPEEAEERRLRVARPEVVKEWVGTSPFSLEYNPFEVIPAETDRFLNPHFFEHPAYRRLRMDYSCQSVALFADMGGGKTSCRQMLKSSLDSPPNLVIEYTNFDELVACYETMFARTQKPSEGLADFGELVRDAGKISVDAHVRGILRQTPALLGVEAESLTPSGASWREQLGHFLESAREKGYTAVHVLVDNVNGYAETRSNPRIAELVIRHLVGNFGLLDIDNLYFKFFLPRSLKERLREYGGFTTGRIRIVDMEWTEDSLQKVLQARLKAASSPRSPVDSLMAFTGGCQPIPGSLLEERAQGSPISLSSWPATVDLESLLVGRAQGSPRRLITLVNMMFQHRAQIWHESGGSPAELYITMADWATLLEHLLRHGRVM